MKNSVLILLICCLLLNACGGADSGNTSTSRPSLPPTTPSASTGNISPLMDVGNILIYGDSQISQGQSTGLALIPKNTQDVDFVHWEQTSGPSLTFLASNSQTIGFDVPQSGNYSLRITVQMKGEAEINTYDVDFFADAGTNEQKASIRLDHTATELSKVSLHVNIPAAKTLEEITWTQLGGPQAQRLQQQGDYLFFDAPSVTSDEVILYRARASYTDGTSDSDEVFITIKNVNFDTNGLFYANNTVISEDMHAYRSASPYKAALERCVYNNNIPSAPTCTFRDLPLIGMISNNPSYEDILNRTLVSHTWMGDRFAQFLQSSAAGPDMLKLLRGVTAIVISYDVRPSFYWSATGAIYLDANNFWQTPNERDTLNDQPDFRSDFGSDLKFSVLWRYTKNNNYYPSASVDKQDRVQRNFLDLEASISWLMYHELAHANDFFPPSVWSSISDNTTPLSYYRSNGASSDELKLTFPLRSSEMHALAQVQFANTTPTAAQRNYSGADVEHFFTPDIAASFYSYFTQREDFATLVERFMMLYRLDAEADVAIIDGRTQSDEPLVVWGQRNRISESSIENRAVFAMDRVYPELGNIRSLLRELPSPIIMRPNQGWFENLEISPELANPFSNEIYKSPDKSKKDDRLTLTLQQQRALEEFDSRNIHRNKPNISN